MNAQGFLSRLGGTVGCIGRVRQRVVRKLKILLPGYSSPVIM